MPPITSVSPDWYLFGVSPNSGPTAFDFLIRCGSSTAVLYVMATIGPTLGTVINCRQHGVRLVRGEVALCGGAALHKLAQSRAQQAVSIIRVSLLGSSPRQFRLKLMT